MRVAATDVFTCEPAHKGRRMSAVCSLRPKGPAAVSRAPSRPAKRGHQLSHYSPRRQSLLLFSQPRLIAVRTLARAATLKVGLSSSLGSAASIYTGCLRGQRHSRDVRGGSRSRVMREMNYLPEFCLIFKSLMLLIAGDIMKNTISARTVLGYRGEFLSPRYTRVDRFAPRLIRLR